MCKQNIHIIKIIYRYHLICMANRFIHDKELIGLTFNDFFRQKIVISRISLLRDGGVFLDQWLSQNQHLVLSTSTSRSKSKWGRESSLFRNTAFFCAESQRSDGTPDVCLITPIYKISDSLTAEQINQTPTLIELYLGIVKKYPKQIHHILCHIQDDLDDRAYLEWMHPKSLLKNK